MNSRAAFKKDLDALLRSGGFSRRGKIWEFRGSDATVVIDLSKSQYDDQHYLNVGFLLHALGAEPVQSTNKCHMYFRLESLFPSERRVVLNSMCLPKDEDAGEKLEFFSFLQRQFVPLAKSWTSEVSLRRAFNQFALVEKGLVLREVRELLGTVGT